MDLTVVTKGMHCLRLPFRSPPGCGYGIASVPVGGSLHYRRSLAHSRSFQGEATGFLDAYP
jgi:hypothetical protein